MKLSIPHKITHHNEEFTLHGIEKQKRRALQVARQLEKESKHFRIKFIKSKYCIYKESDNK